MSVQSTAMGVGAFGRLGYGNPSTVRDDEVPAVAGDVPF